MKKDVESHYRIVGLVGEGTFSQVFKAVDQRNGQLVALKKVKIRKAEDGLPTEFIREVESLSRLKDENIVTINEIFVGKTNINIVYPYSQTDLEKLMSVKMARPFTIGEVRELMRQILSGLKAMHSIGIMHRDLKPSNLLLSIDDARKVTLKLADFGQARVFLADGDKMMFSIEVGTKWYKAPEILYGVRNYNEKVDMWSAGCLLAELLDHCPIFTGTTDLD